jgi:hypothetical protein
LGQNLSLYMNNSYTKAFLLSVLITGVIFSLLPLLFARLGILSLGNELLLSSFIAPALGLCLYGYLNSRFPNNDLEKFSLSVSNLMLGICVAFLFFGYLKWYTAILFFISFALLAYIEYVNKLRFMYRFYRTYALLLIPFYVTCLLIKNRPVLKFDENATLKLKLGGVSVEAYFYFMAMLLVSTYLFELFKRKMTKAHG